MTNSTTDRLVDDYLTRLADAAVGLPPDRRSELVSEIREHITASLSGGTGTDESSVRTMLDRLGEPDDIVAAAMDIDPPGHPVYPQDPPRRQQGIGLEVGAIIMLTAGSLIPVIGWLVGVILLWSSGLWRRSEKVLATLIFPGGLGGILLWGVAFATFMASQTCVAAGGPIQASPSGTGGPAIASTQGCTGFALPSWLLIPILLIVVMAPVLESVVHLSRALSRASLDVCEPNARTHGSRTTTNVLLPKDAT